MSITRGSAERRRNARWADKTVLRSRAYRLLHLLFDLGALAGAWIVTREIRLLMNPYMAITIPRTEMDSVAPRLSALLLLWSVAALLRGTYRSRPDPSLATSMVEVIESATLVSSLNILLTFFSRHFGADLSRSFVLLFAPVSFGFLVVSFLASVALAHQIERRWPERTRIAIVGAGRVAEDMVKAIRLKEHGTSLRGLILPASFAAAGGAPAGFAIAPLPVLGTTRDLAAVINREGLDRIIVACDTLTPPEVDYCGEITNRMGIRVSQPIRATRGDVQVTYQNDFGLPMIDLESKSFLHWQEVTKRLMDVVIASLAILLLSPLLLAVAALIRLTSEGPALYRSRRVGKGGRHFTFWKFRTMYVRGIGRLDLASRNEGSGHVFKIRRDPRITPLGGILRRLSLDEMPQLFNVLTGDMSLVGPRPLPADDLDPDGMSREFIEWARERAHVLPGITGLWQVSGRSTLPFRRMVEMDLEYIRNRSLKLDLAILLATPVAVLSGKGAY